MDPWQLFERRLAQLALVHAVPGTRRKLDRLASAAKVSLLRLMLSFDVFDGLSAPCRVPRLQLDKLAATVEP